MSDTPAHPAQRPWKTGGTGPVGFLALHGFTGSPAAMRPLAEHVHTATGAPVSLPLLPGHGTSVDDLAGRTWEEFVEAVDAAAEELLRECDSIIVAGLSMGGALALNLAAARRDVSEVLVVNPALYVDSPLAPLLWLARRVVRTAPGIRNDINMPGQDEHAYPRVPVPAVWQIHRGFAEVRAALWQIRCSVTYALSGQDGVVRPRSWHCVRTHLTAPLTTMPLPMSAHVATLDYDADRIAACAEAAVLRSRGEH